jgi:hypothetical protein
VNVTIEAMNPVPNECSLLAAVHRIDNIATNGSPSLFGGKRKILA